ncbi:histone chaperone ASF1 [Enteropsectra breve]|nr:histone chaperone ASF1 [Enteropsectra breve]
MSKVDLVSVKVDTDKKYKPTDSINFLVTLKVHEDIDEDLEFEVSYFGDAYSEYHDQKIGAALVGPLKAGEQFFNIETSPIDLTKIPIKSLFGVTTVLLSGKYKNEQFIRIGYIANVNYPNINIEELADSSDKAIDEMNGEEEEGSIEEEEVEVAEDEELSDDEAENEQEEEDIVEGEENEEENAEDDEEGDDESDEEPHNASLLETLSNILAGKNKSEPTPLETPVTYDKDEFEYKGHTFNKNEIEIEILEKPIIHCYEISWGAALENNEDEEIVESSDENNDNSENLKKKGEDNEPSKKVKLDDE